MKKFALICLIFSLVFGSIIFANSPSYTIDKYGKAKSSQYELLPLRRNTTTSNTMGRAYGLQE